MGEGEEEKGERGTISEHGSVTETMTSFCNESCYAVGEGSSVWKHNILLDCLLLL